jgi:hypothetical protein
MKLFKVAVVGVALFSAGCASQMAWQRMDGRPVHPWAFDRAMAECRDRAYDRDESAVQVMQRCMARRGYVWAEAYGYNGYYDNGYGGYPRHHHHRHGPGYY